MTGCQIVSRVRIKMNNDNILKRNLKFYVIITIFFLKKKRPSELHNMIATQTDL